jgi:hypothetical protein
VQASRARVNLRLILAVVIIFAFVAATIGGFHYLQSAKTVESSPSALSIGVNLNDTSLSWGQPLSIHIWENNSLPEQNNVTVVSDWAVSNLQVWSCTPSWPMHFGLMRGHFTTSNVSEGQVLQIPIGLNCSSFFLTHKVNPFLVFEPFGAVLNNATNYWTLQVPLGQYVPVPGWALQQAVCGTHSANCSSLYTGLYTVVVGDEWGHLAFGYFSLSTPS